MGSRYEVEVTVGSGQDLKNVNWRNGDLKPYVVLWVDDGPKCSTGVDHHDGENPDWRDDKLVVRLPPSTTRPEDAVLHIDVVHANAAAGTKPLVGSARLPLRDVIDEVGIGSKKASRTLRLKRPSGRPQGRVDVRVAIREAARYHDPSPYPTPAGSGSRDPYHAAPPPPAYYGQPPQAAPSVGYPAYAPSAPAYAAAPPVVVAPAATVAAPQKGNKMGMGTSLAVGAAAGMLGGLALAGGASYLGERFNDGCCDSDDDDYY
ncbi:protein SRC2-like [Panicum virgatum]|uniref:C2 domain-containing protein n=1 Tax=Panicum virgatum TaxID=38727 RepID=A0A8T0RRV4_PANVG|nr:protein SRC2-like [Panicum virgatum]KAG2587885.1 hypothetical protein PVAP13_5NG141400 [Panicum virgatum]